MENRLCGFIAIGVLIAGCAGSGAKEEQYDYIGWVCDGARQSDDWSCEMREIKDGRAVARSAVTAASDATPAVAQDTSRPSGQDQQHNLQIVTPPKQSWRNQLPGLNSEPVISDAEALSPAERKLKSRPPRTPEPVPSTVIKKTPPSPPPPQGVPVPQSSVSEPVAYAMGGSAGSGLSVDTEKAGYTLQLAAFEDTDQLNAFIERHRLGDLAVQQFQAYSQKRQCQLLVWGAFESPVEAREAWRAIARQYPGIDPWVRSMSSLDTPSGQRAAVDG